ncbi:EAL domain-containing protein [Ferroacidibacillus organovorans]|uniref:EAL domain-containing protein n=1 Tax=Ferroacidibacillus organovorans TaxID=1765683 RepID=A0A101XNJ4_9BACL|nr:EAL domain-containing protein [Ferroacidibacillus organovorans]KUO94712.1 hypothetical protein ATW55_02290 [Ferroacidibacillus organovorans]
MTNCPGCAPSERGFIISFYDTERCDAFAETIPVRVYAQWSRLAPNQLFIGERLLFQMADYTAMEHNPDTWRVVHSDAPLETLAWPDVLKMRPGLFVDDLIEQKRLKMMMQPIVSIVKDEQASVIGYEMLIRGIGEDNQIITPDRIFSVARDQEALFRLDRACRVEAIATAGQNDLTELIFVNFLPTAIYVPEHCLQTTLEAVENFGIRKRQIVFEVVETERVDDLAHLKRILNFYRSQGFRYALDDVGQGFNDLSMLTQLEPDIIKLDRAFVSNIDKDADKRRVAKTISRLAQSIGSVRLAEGVETKAEADVLLELGFGWQQGFYYGRPSFQPVPGEAKRAE